MKYLLLTLSLLLAAPAQAETNMDNLKDQIGNLQDTAYYAGVCTMLRVAADNNASGELFRILLDAATFEDNTAEEAGNLCRKTIANHNELFYVINPDKRKKPSEPEYTF